MRRVLRLINEISLGWMFAALTGAVIGFAGIYWLLGLSGAEVLIFTYESDRAMTFADALYFSLVTISSLGYGDIRPVGWARLFVGGEVILGLAFFGLLVAKISSVKQDYILRRMYYSELIDQRLEEFIDQLEEYRKLYRITSNLLMDGDIDPELTTTFKSSVQETTLFYQVHNLAHEILSMMQFEIRNGGFFGDVSDSLVSRILASLQAMLDHTLKLAESDFDRACEFVLCGNERWLTELAELVEEMAQLGLRGSKMPDMRDQCEDLLAKIATLRSEVLTRIG